MESSDTMGYFPFFIDIKGKKCIIVGGGNVAARKIEKLLPFEPYITVIAPEISDDITSLNGIKTVSYTHLDVYKRQRFLHIILYLVL